MVVLLLSFATQGAAWMIRYPQNFCFHQHLRLEYDDDALRIRRRRRRPLVEFGRSRRSKIMIWSSFSSSAAPYRFDDETLVDAAAQVTREHGSQLLGIKSIGVDYGLARTGVAKTVGYSPEPVAILSNPNTTDVCRHIIRYARTEHASRIIVGLPLHKNGTVAEQTNLTLTFGQELARMTLTELGPDVSVQWWDERYTSKYAAARQRSANPGDISSSSLYGTLDADAACIILENYYHENSNNNGSSEAAAQSLITVSGSDREQCLRIWQQSHDQAELARQTALQERELKIRRRKEAISRHAQQQQEVDAASNGSGSKKKKRKRRRNDDTS